MRQSLWNSLSPQVLASVIAASFHLVVGVALAYSAILIPQIEESDSDIKVTKVDSSWLASSLVLIVPVGALLAGVCMDWIGRLNTIILGAVPCAIGWALIASASNTTMILIGRLLTGIAAGCGTSASIVYITEVSKPELRGSLISICPTLASLGMLIIYAEGAFVSWRLAAWISLIYIAVPILPVLFWIPESPLWLISKGKNEKAEKALMWLTRKKISTAHQNVNSVVKSQEMKRKTSDKIVSHLKAFLHPSGYKPLLILFGLFLVQQFSGIYITLFYAVTFFEDVGTTCDPKTATILFGAARFVMSLCNTGLLKKYGRRPLCILSGTGMAVCMVISGCFTQYLKSGGDTGGWVPVTCVLLYMCMSMIGFLNIPWTMTAELFPIEIRGVAHGIVISVAHIIMFTAVYSYRNLLEFFGSYGVQWFFAANSLLGSGFVWLLLPETHQISLSDIQNYFHSNTLYITKKHQSDNWIKTASHRDPLIATKT